MTDAPPQLDSAKVHAFVSTAYPATRDELGPHGIPLVEHARAGGDGARARVVVELLETAAVAG